MEKIRRSLSNLCASVGSIGDGFSNSFMFFAVSAALLEDDILDLFFVLQYSIWDITRLCLML